MILTIASLKILASVVSLPNRSTKNSLMRLIPSNYDDDDDNDDDDNNNNDDDDDDSDSDDLT